MTGVGLTDEFKERATELFHIAVDAGIHKHPLFQSLQMFLDEYHMEPWASDEKIDAIKLLADNIERLEECLEAIAEEKQQLVAEIEQQTDCYLVREDTGSLALQEETNDGWFETSNQRRPKQSTVSEMLLEPTNEEDAFAKENQVGDFRMRQYLQAMGHDREEF
jgi:hypothetical protein